MAWVTDMTHYLDADGRVADMPAPAARLADYFGRIVSAASRGSLGQLLDLGVSCRRRPGRRPCAGEVEAVIDADDCIQWGCSQCDDHGYISHWRGTPWDRGTVS